MRFLVILVVALMVFGICGILGGLVMLWAGHTLSRIDAFGTTPFQAAVICTGVAIVFAIVINQLITSLLFPITRIPAGEDEEDEEDDFPVRLVKKPRKWR